MEELLIQVLSKDRLCHLYNDWIPCLRLLVYVPPQQDTRTSAAGEHVQESTAAFKMPLSVREKASRSRMGKTQMPRWTHKLAATTKRPRMKKLTQGQESD